jgi:hypothetical protein
MTAIVRYCQKQQRCREAGIREMVDWYLVFVVAVQWCDHYPFAGTYVGPCWGQQQRREVGIRG